MLLTQEAHVDAQRQLREAHTKLQKSQADQSELLSKVRHMQTRPAGAGDVEDARPFGGQSAPSGSSYGRIGRSQRKVPLNLAEKMALRGSELLVQSPRARMVVLVYGSVLHFLVLATLYRLQFCVFEKASLQMELMKDEAFGG